MASSATLPTVVVGVGQAGIEILNSIADLAAKRGVDDHYKYIAIDTNKSALNRHTPDDSVDIFLQKPSMYMDQDLKQYPYLLPDWEMGVKGAERRRPIGRYKLDNRDQPADFSDRYTEIKRHIRDHLSDYRDTLKRSDQSMNIFLAHSLGGGTGSGTFPLMAAIIDDIANDLRSDVHVYTAAFGVAPELSLPGWIDLPGQPIYYANTYASLSDLQQLLDTRDEGETRSLPVYSRRLMHEDLEDASRGSIEDALDAEQAFKIDSPPFDHYFVIGVNESKIEAGHGGQESESYAEMIDNTVAEGVYALSQYGGDLENWAKDGGGRARLATIAQTEVTVPLDELREYCRLKARIDDLESLLYEGFDVENADLQDDRDIVQRIIRDPEIALRTYDDPDEVRADIGDRITEELGAGHSLISRTPEEIRAAVELIESEYNFRILPLAVDLIADAYAEIAPEIKTEREELVTRLWNDYNMAANNQFGGSMISSISGRERALRDFFEAKIEEYEEILEDLEPNFWDDWVWFIPGRREKHQEWLDSFRSSLTQLVEMEQRHNRLEELRQAVADERTAMENEFRGYSRDLSDLRRDVRGMAETLTDTDRHARRIGYLPIEADKLEDISLDQLDTELDSLTAFIDLGYVDENVFDEAFEKQLNRSHAWEGTMLDETDTSGLQGNLPRGVQDTWIIFSEANGGVVDLSNVVIQGDSKTSDAKGEPGYMDDDYSIRFVSFFEHGTPETLKAYSELERLAESGAFDRSLGEVDWRHSFAYMEWYPHDIQRAFELELELPTPPELDINQVSLDVESLGELKNKIKTYGLNRYLFLGTYWEDYQGDGFEGWEEALENNGIDFRELQRLSPEAEAKSHWLSGRITWDDLLERYREEFADNRKLNIVFV